jgi:hypothetical protein
MPMLLLATAALTKLNPRADDVAIVASACLLAIEADRKKDEHQQEISNNVFRLHGPPIT